jgi:ParB family chromosome partitioning protein
MKIDLDDIHLGPYDVRDGVDDTHVNELAESLDEDGQWNPVIVRPGENGSYEMISGHTRYRAAKQLGWSEIEASVENVEDREAEKLALKTNLKRKGMSKLEEGRVVNNLMNEHNLTQSEVADKLDKSSTWVSDRVKVALNLTPEVKGLVEEGELTYNLARVVAQCDESNQLEFAKLLIESDVTQVGEASELLRRFRNDTLLTIGYEGRDFEEFISILKEAETDVLVDVRASTSSNYKPEFNGDVLSERLEERGIEYRHMPDLGVKNLIRNPYKDGAIGHDCFRDWYQWWVNEESDLDLNEFVDELENTGTPALMCIEKHSEPEESQDIYCHRHHLADMIQGVSIDDRTLFPNRKDL